MTTLQRISLSRPLLRHCLNVALLVSAVAATAATEASNADGQNSDNQGPMRLSTGAAKSGSDEIVPARSRSLDENHRGAPPKASPPNEFELYASEIAGTPVRRLGSDLMIPSSDAAVETNRQVPPEYVVGLGDEIQLTLWGSVDADLRLTVDRSGRIVIPRVGPVVVAGVRLSDLNDLLSRRVSQVFKNFQLSATLGRLRSIRYYVTGFASRPGAYTVSSLATVMTGLLQAGGPSGAGSFRRIELRRNGQVISRFDLYDLLTSGDKKADLPLQADDIIHISPIGPQVAVLGSVNGPAVIELKGGETIADALATVGGLTAVADQSRVSVERLSERNNRRIAELALPANANEKLVNGDVLRAFSGVRAALPQDKQYKQVHVDGEVARPGDYVLPPTSTLPDAIRAAGGFTSQAYVFGTDFSRESVRRTQEENYNRALRDLEIEFSRNSSTQKALTADEASAQTQRATGTERLIDRLRAARPTGRIVLQLEQSSKELPPIQVEQGDRIHIPARPNTVGVFGSVFNGGSYLLREGSTVDDVLKMAGGPTRGADTSSVFVIRANGTVNSARQNGGGWLLSSGISVLQALPGDTVFVPEEMNKTTLMQEAKDWTQILYQFGLGAAALKTIKN